MGVSQQRLVRIVFSRKGFDSAAGGGPSPIVEGRPLSLPIPTTGPSRTTYGDLDLGQHVAHASRGRYGAADRCHHDPMFLPGGTCLFGQCGAAQTHLANRGVGPGDVFLFFGLFRDAGKSHHRIFGYLRVAETVDLASCASARRSELAALGHPHALGLHSGNDTIWVGKGATAGSSPDVLRLSIPGGPPSLWRRPPWLVRGGLSYHDRADRWLRGDGLRAVSRGQEFVADVGRRSRPHEWLAQIISAIDR